MGHVARMSDMGSANKIFVGKSEGKRPSRKLKNGGEDKKCVWIGFIWLRMVQ